MKKFLNGISRALCVMSFCVFAGCSYAGDSGSGNMITYASGKNGGLEGQSLQTQGALVKEIPDRLNLNFPLLFVNTDDFFKSHLSDSESGKKKVYFQKLFATSVVHFKVIILFRNYLP